MKYANIFETSKRLTRTVLICAFLVIMIYFYFSKGCELIDVCKTMQESSQFEYMLNRYQTLIAGVFALIAATITYQGILYQIDKESADRKRANEERLFSKTRMIGVDAHKAIQKIITYVQKLKNIEPDDQDNFPYPYKSRELKIEIPSSLKDNIILSEISARDLSAVTMIISGIEQINSNDPSGSFHYEGDVFQDGPKISREDYFKFINEYEEALDFIAGQIQSLSHFKKS